MANSASPIVREFATRALGRDENAGIAALFEALRDDRAKFAIYSVRRSF